MEYVIYIPVFNSENTIPELLKRLGSLDLKIKLLLFINDGSTDKTAEIIRENMKSIPYLKLLDKKKNEGAVSALFDSMKQVEDAITNPEKTIIIRMDSDLEHQPEDIEKLIKPIISGETKISAGYIPFDSRSGDALKEFNEKAGREQSMEFLSLDIPQFCPGFIAMRGDLFLKIHPLLAEKAKKFRSNYNEELLSMDFVILVIAKSLGHNPVAVKLSPIEDRYIKKQPEEKLKHYLDCHKKTMEFLKDEFSRE